MQKTPQMEAILGTIQSYKLELQKKLLELENADREALDPDTFAALLTGLQSFRRLPGVPEHMGFNAIYHCPSQEDANELRNYLGDMFGIRSPEDLGPMAHDFFHIHNEYADFLADWNDTPNFDVNELDEESRQIYENSRDFAENFRDLVGEQGFLAWDIGERSMLVRASCACGIIDEQQCIQSLNAEIELAFTNFHSWADYAVSLACGAVYFMFASTGRSEDDGLADFLNINLDIIKRLFDDNIWKLNAWFFVTQKKLAIDPSQVQNLLDDDEMHLTCICSDRVLCDGYRVSVMIRDVPANDLDSGWRFFAGDEDQAYMESNAGYDNFGVVPLNLVCNYSQDIISYLDAPAGTKLARANDELFHDIDSIDPAGDYHSENDELAKENDELAKLDAEDKAPYKNIDPDAMG